MTSWLGKELTMLGCMGLGPLEVSTAAGGLVDVGELETDVSDFLGARVGADKPWLSVASPDRVDDLVMAIDMGASPISPVGERSSSHASASNR